MYSPYQSLYSLISVALVPHQINFSFRSWWNGSVYKNWLLFQRAWVGTPVPTWQCTIVCNESFSSCSDLHRHTCIQNAHIYAIKKLKNNFSLPQKITITEDHNLAKSRKPLFIKCPTQIHNLYHKSYILGSWSIVKGGKKDCPNRRQGHLLWDSIF